MTPQRTATTVHGEIEYETVTCDSCKNEVRKEDASRVITFNDAKKIKRRRTWKEWYVENGDYAEGWFCELCKDDPAAIPSKETVIEKLLDNDVALIPIGALFFILGCLLTASVMM